MIGDAVLRLGRRVLGLGRSRLAVVLVAVVVLATGAMGDARPPELLDGRGWPPEDSYSTTTVVYDTEHWLAYDLYRPHSVTGANPPVILYLHGGGWTRGDRADLRLGAAGRAIAAQLSEGFVVASIDYRLAFTDPFPAAILDVKTAVRFLRSQPGYESSPVILAGSSAGGNLAVMAAVSAGVPALEPNRLGRTEVQAAISLDGPLDLALMLQPPWSTRSWAYFGAHVPGTVDHDRYGTHLETGEMVPAYLGCTDARLTGDSPRLAPGCQGLVNQKLPAASARTYISSDDPPLYLACMSPSASNLRMLPDCAADNRPFAEAYIAAHDGDTDAAWIDQLDQPGATHFTVDTHLTYRALQDFLARVRG